MSETTAAGSVPVPLPEKGLVNRLAGVIVSPRETFEDVVARPRWLGMLLLTTLVTAFGVTAFMSTEVGQQAWLEEAVRGSERWGGRMDDKAYARMEKMAALAPAMVGVPLLIMPPVTTLVLAAILFGIMKGMTGSATSFKQAFAVVVHAAPVGVVHQAVGLPLSYISGKMSGSTSLGVLLPMLEETSFLARLAGGIDLFFIWWIIVLAIGLSVLYKRPARPIAFVFLAVYALFAVVVAAVFGSRGGG